jgi:DNA repair protein RecO (recombination protein O)
MAGFGPNLTKCVTCGRGIENIEPDKIVIDIKAGGLVCRKCRPLSQRGIELSKGTIKQLLWVAGGDLAKAERIRFTPRALQEGLDFLEVFVPYHLGKAPRSLTFLKKIRA